MTQSFGAGYSVYPQVTADDFWWFYLALENYNGLIADGQILYQWITFEDTAASSPEAPFSVGCSVTVGTETDYAIQYYTQTTSTAELLFSNSTEVIDQAYTS